MAGTKYVVDVEFRQSGDPSALADKAGGKVDALKSKFDTTRASSGELGSAISALGSSAVGAFTGIVEKVGEIGIGLAALGVSTGIAAVTYGVIGLNSNLETTKVSLGAVLNANNQANGIEDGVAKAAGWVAQMKKDARDLPGEFEDLLGIVQSSAGTAFNAGMDIPKFEKVASSVMAAAKALNVQTDQAGRELGQLFEGRAGADNVLGMRLKIDAHALYEDIDKVKKHFKDLSAEGRVKAIEDAVAKFEPAIKAFGNTYDAQSSTLVDNVKNLIQIGTKGLFGSVVSDLGDVNNWFEANRDTVEQYAKRAGVWLVYAHDKARKIAEEWIPILKDFGERAYGKFVELWEDAAPIIEGIAKSIKDFLGDKDSIDRMSDLLKLYIAAKVGGAIASGGPFAGLMSAGKADLATGGTGADTISSLKTSGAQAVMLVGISAAVLQALSLKRDVDENSKEKWNNAVGQADILAQQQGGGHIMFNADTEATLKDANDNASTFKEKTSHVVEGMMNLDAWNGSVADIAMRAMLLARSSGQAAEDMQLAAINIHNAGVDIAAAAAQARLNAKGHGDAVEGATDPNKKKRDKDKAGGGNTTVNINFTISSNQSPDQIARKVVQKLVDKRRFRTTSSGVPNWGVLPPGT